MSLLLDVMRKTSYCDRKLRTDGWQMGFTAHKVTGKTLGIIGMGNIGAAVAQRAKGFDMNILYWGPRRKPDAEAKYQAKYCETLEELTEQSDIISLHCPLTEATHHILDAHGIAKLKPGKTIINTGRGALIDETALVERLMVGDIFAGLDVFEHEPAVPTELLTLDNVVLTPHIGSATLECRLQIAQCVVANIQHFISHGKPIHSALD
jgi:glyoxylate reductase